ncbi:MAG: hypothetical protein LBK42_11185 [Propionibacteriaceae bacterium]|jgi:hypothetical protein|nr:hypothetical protein [Propionibacteriaceae bacterium]
MSRYYDWSPLGCSCDPVPGDPDTVQRVAGEYQQTADAIREARDGLNRLSHGGSKSQGLQKLLDDIKEVRGQLDRVEGRVAGVAQVLTEYHPVLRSSQATSLEALREAEAAADAGRRADRQRANVRSTYNCSNDPDERERLADDFRRLDQNVSTANANLRVAKEKLQRAINERNNASVKAQNELKDIDEDSPVHDTLGDRIGEILQAVGEIVKAVYDGLKYIANLIADNAWWLNIVLVAIAPVCPFAMLALAVVKGATIVSLAMKVLETGATFVNAISGNASWGEFFSQLTDAAVGVGLFFVGRQAGKGIKQALDLGKVKSSPMKLLLKINNVGTNLLNQSGVVANVVANYPAWISNIFTNYSGRLAQTVIGVAKKPVKDLWENWVSPAVHSVLDTQSPVTTYNCCCSDGS